MKVFGNKKEKVTVKTEIDRILELMRETDPASPEYATYNEQLNKLQETAAKKAESSTKAMHLLDLVVNMVELGSVLHYEKFDTIRGKGVSFITKFPWHRK